MRFPKKTAALPACLLALSLPLLAACGGDDADAGDAAVAVATPAAGTEAAATPAAAPAAPAEPVGPATDLPANELGEIMVLEYHRIGDNEGEWYRSAANFRKDLQTLYEKGYRPVTMKQVLEGNIDIPRGTTPVVFTVDDASKGQFYYRPDGSIDPNTMVGMWDAFQKENPGWKNGAVWCILPAAEHPSNFFGETKTKETPREEREANIRKKMEYLVQNRHEVCNHTLYHARLDRGSDRQVQDWIGIGQDSLKAYLPADYQLTTFALPLGMWPKNKALASQGTYRDGKRYDNKVILEVSGGPNESPYDKAWNPRSVNRLIVAPGALERQLKAYESDPSKRFVSDGDANVITVPAGKEAQVDQGRFAGKQVRTAR